MDTFEFVVAIIYMVIGLWLVSYIPWNFLIEFVLASIAVAFVYASIMLGINSIKGS